MTRKISAPATIAILLLATFLALPATVLAGGPRSSGGSYSTDEAYLDKGDSDLGEGPGASARRAAVGPSGTFYLYRLRLRRNPTNGRVISKAVTLSFAYQGGPFSNAYYLEADNYLCRNGVCSDWGDKYAYNVYKVWHKWYWPSGYANWYTRSYHEVQDHGWSNSRYQELSRYL